MLNNHNAGERTLGEFVKLLSRTGWKVVEVHAAHQSWMPQIVAVPVAVSPTAATPTATSSPPQPGSQAAAVVLKTEGLKIETKVNAINGVLHDPSSKASTPVTDPMTNDSPVAAPEGNENEKKSRRRSIWKTLGFSK